MPTATGSVAFLGAARFQGYWDASQNLGTGSALDGAFSGTLPALFSTGSSTGGGYSDGRSSLTASAGLLAGYTAGTHNVDGITNWNTNDWCVYSGSAGSSDGTWIKLAFEDTIASILVGDLSSSSFHIGSTDFDKHVIFASGTLHSGTSNFTYDYTTDNLLVTGNLHIADDKRLNFGAANDAYIEYDEDGDDQLVISGSATGMALSGSNINIHAADSFTVQGHPDQPYNLSSLFVGPLSSSAGIRVIGRSTDAEPAALIQGSNSPALEAQGNIVTTGSIDIADDKKLYFGTNRDAYIEYDEDGSDNLILSSSDTQLQGGLILKRATGGKITFKDEDDNIQGQINGSTQDICCLR